MADSRQALGTFLGSLGESSSFVATGSVAPVLPGLEVKGVGAIGTPVTEADSKRLIAKATQAPYGRGTETIVDTDVRRVWQLEPSQFFLRNAAWNAHLATIVNEVGREFGIRQKVDAKLYKLLIYEKGSFFAAHRDTEKVPGMFATLVICLPSRHRGGTLIVKHDGQTTRIDFGGENSEFKTQYAAFYADCQHEISPVVAGYRVCLVYNLAIARNKRQPSAPAQASTIDHAAQLLKAILTDAPDAPRKIAIPFEYQYTAAGLDPKQLKGSDRARADILARAAKSLDYQCYIALLTIEQSGEVDYETWDGGYSGGGSYGWSYEEDDEFGDDFDNHDGDSDDADAEMGEIFDEAQSLDHWLDFEGHKQPFGQVHLEDDEILNREDRDSWSVRQEVHEATGNEGASMDRWYRQAVIVIWPGERTFEILAGEGQASALPELERRMARSKKPAALAECRTFAEKIIDHWNNEQRSEKGNSSYSERMLKLLKRIGDAQLATRFLRDVLPNACDGSEGKTLLQVCDQFGWEALGPSLGNFLNHQDPKDDHNGLGKIVSICEVLCCDPPELSKERRAVCRSLADPLERLIDKYDKLPFDEWRWEDDEDNEEHERAGVVAKVARMFAAIGAMDHLERFISHVLEKRRRYDLHRVLIPDTKALHQSLEAVPAAQPAATRLLNHCLGELRTATAKPVEPPKDWKRKADLKCECEDCAALSKFLRDPAARVGRFPLRNDRRRHLHQQIDRHGCDCTHVTERKGSPQTLVCTKTQNSYERRLKQNEVEKKLLSQLQAMAGRKGRVAVKKTARRQMSKR
jgi:hypothetical protein